MTDVQFTLIKMIPKLKVLVMSTGFILFTGSRDTVGMHIYCPEIQIAQVDFYTDF